MKSLILTIVLLLFCLVPGYAQRPDVRFEHLSLEQGLSQGSVFCVFQDSKGFMWVGTEDGLNQYDGYHFKIYKNEPGNTRSISSNLIYTIYEDRQGMLWVGTEGGGLNRFDRATQQFIHYRHQPGEPTSLSNNAVFSILEDRAGNLWVGTFGGGLELFNRKTGQFTHYHHEDNNPASLSNDNVQTIFEDRQGILWIGTEGGGLEKFNPQTGQFTHYRHQDGNPASLSLDVVHCLYEDRQGRFWVGTEGGGLELMDRNTGKFTHYQHQPSAPNSLSSNNITAIHADQQGMLWLGSYNGGLNHFDPKTGRIIHYRNLAGDATSLSSDLVSCLYEDRSGSLWVGTFALGVNKMNQAFHKFTHYSHDPDNPNSLSHNTVYTMVEDQQGDLWIATEGGGLNRLNRKNNVFTHYRQRPNDPRSLSNDYVIAVYEDGAGGLWVGTDSGLDRFDRATSNFTHYAHRPGDSTSLSSNLVQVIYEDHLGNFWVGTEGGLNRFDRATGKFTHYLHKPNNPNSLSENSVYALYGDWKGILWIGTDGSGLNRFDPRTGKFSHYQHRADDPNSLSNDYVIAIHEDHQGGIWLGTMGGLNHFDRTTKQFTRYDEKNGLPNTVIGGILEDDQANLWISTNKGLAKFNLQKKTCKNYDVRDGLQSNEFNAWSYYRNKRGEMFFGGINGFNVFNPRTIAYNPHPPAVVLTDFQIFNQSVPISPGGDAPNQYTILEKHITETKHIILPYDKNVFSFEFTALDFTMPERNQYAYRMEGFEPGWVYSGGRRFVTYTNLDPGEYTFRAKASNNDGIWNEKGMYIRITITPPWWRTWWAYTLYGLLFIASLYGLRRYTIARERLKNDLKLERLESEKLHEIDQLKTRFFTNISHEFRTPLTLILGPLEKRLSRMKESTNTDHKDDQLMYRNAQRLLQLINQLLDISKLEAGKVKLEVIQGDIVQYLRAIVFSFSSLAESRRIALNFQTEVDTLRAFFDKDKLEKIVSNLLSNAFKFTPEEGTINVQVSLPKGNASEEPADWIEIVVQDSGIGIPAERVSRIFDRFYQVDGSHTREREGTGIGLALTKELIALHHGEINVSSEIGKGTRFTIRLPLSEEQLRTDEIVHVSSPDPNGSVNIKPRRSFLSEDDADLSEEHEATPYESMPLILIVEDNDDVRNYIRDNFDGNYRIMEATDGEAGLARAIETIPDLIISDLMMPKMDGMELCRRLKTDERTSHVPVILLTARASEGIKLQGLEMGADDYLTKPFSPQELQVRVKNLIEQRKKLRALFNREVKLEPKGVTITSADEKFLQRAIEVVEKHMVDPDFSVENFESEMSLSKMQLYRKLKALTDQSPNEFIRQMRLKKAAMLISQQSGNIAEITYEVGFNNLSYFAKCFREMYGMSPSEYANASKEKPVSTPNLS